MYIAKAGYSCGNHLLIHFTVAKTRPTKDQSFSLAHWVGTILYIHTLPFASCHRLNNPFGPHTPKDYSQPCNWAYRTFFTYPLPPLLQTNITSKQPCSLNPSKLLSVPRIHLQQLSHAAALVSAAPFLH